MINEERVLGLQKYLELFCVSKKNRKTQREIMLDNYDLYFPKHMSMKEVHKVIDSPTFHDTGYRVEMTKDIRDIKHRKIIVSSNKGIYIPTEEEVMNTWIKQRISILKRLKLNNIQGKLINLNNQCSYNFDEEEIDIVKTMGDSNLIAILPDEEREVAV